MIKNAIILSLLLTTGCGTFFNQMTDAPGSSFKNPYPGVKWDIEGIKSVCDSGNYNDGDSTPKFFVVPILALSIPFDGVWGTIKLPFGD